MPLNWSRKNSGQTYTKTNEPKEYHRQSEILLKCIGVRKPDNDDDQLIGISMSWKTQQKKSKINFLGCIFLFTTKQKNERINVDKYLHPIPLSN